MIGKQKPPRVPSLQRESDWDREMDAVIWTIEQYWYIKNTKRNEFGLTYA